MERTLQLSGTLDHGLGTSSGAGNVGVCEHVSLPQFITIETWKKTDFGVPFYQTNG